MEWGNFWSSHLPCTSYDEELDAKSLNPGEQGFEKLVSGMFLGDIVRRVILRIAQRIRPFWRCNPFQSSQSIYSQFSVFRHRILIELHEDESADLREVARVMKDVLGISNVPFKVRNLIMEICDLVTRRASRLAAGGIVEILKKIGRDGAPGLTGSRMKSDATTKMKRAVIAMDGALYEHYPKFKQYLLIAIDELLGEAAQHVDIRLFKDESENFGQLMGCSSKYHFGQSEGFRVANTRSDSSPKQNCLHYNPSVL